MTDADDRLKALFAADAPPARDPAFTAAVMGEIARRRFLVDMAMLAGVSLLGGLALWSIWPALSSLLASLGPSLSPVMAGLSVAITAVVLLDRRVTAALGVKHD